MTVSLWMSILSVKFFFTVIVSWQYWLSLYCCSSKLLSTFRQKDRVKRLRVQAETETLKKWYSGQNQSRLRHHRQERRKIILLAPP